MGYRGDGTEILGGLRASYTFDVIPYATSRIIVLHALGSKNTNIREKSAPQYLSSRFDDYEDLAHLHRLHHLTMQCHRLLDLDDILGYVDLCPIRECYLCASFQY